jgi:hypothetical protein
VLVPQWGLQPSEIWVLPFPYRRTSHTETTSLSFGSLILGERLERLFSSGRRSRPCASSTHVVPSHVDSLRVRLETYMDRPLGYILPDPVNDAGRTFFTI